MIEQSNVMTLHLYVILEYRALDEGSAAMVVRINLGIGDSCTWRVSKTYLLVNARLRKKSQPPQPSFQRGLTR